MHTHRSTHPSSAQRCWDQEALKSTDTFSPKGCGCGQIVHVLQYWGEQLLLTFMSAMPHKSTVLKHSYRFLMSNISGLSPSRSHWTASSVITFTITSSFPILVYFMSVILLYYDTFTSCWIEQDALTTHLDHKEGYENYLRYLCCLQSILYWDTSEEEEKADILDQL